MALGWQSPESALSTLVEGREFQLAQLTNIASTYARLVGHGNALKLALTDGISRLEGDNRRGSGFRPIFHNSVNL
jgi:hypothetical protein